jgi:hypothetical protein
MDPYHQYTQQFIENRAKFNHTQALPPTPRAPTTEALSSACHNGKIDAANTLSSTTKMSSSVLTDDASALPLTHGKSRSITQISELIQRFTSEMLNSEIPSLEPQSQSSMEEPLEFKPNDGIAQTSWRSTMGSLPQSPTISSSAFKANTTRHDHVKWTTLSLPPKSLNLMKPTETSVQHGVTLRHPSDFCRLENHDIKSTEPLLEQSVMTDTDTVASKRAASLQMPPSSNVDSGVFGTIKRTPQVARKAHTTTALPFRPPNWVKLPKTSTDETDATPTWIPLSSSSAEVTGSSTEASVGQPHLSRTSSFQSYVAQPILTRTYSLQSYPATEGSTSSEACASSQMILRSQERRVSDLRKEQNSSSARIIRKSIEPNKAPNATLSSYTPSIKSENLISKWESSNNNELSNSHLQSNVKFIRRSSSSSLLSFPRRSQMPTIPVKLLVKKFSEKN